MIHVLASIKVKEGHLHDFLEIFRANVPAVRQEDGCIEYAPAVDVDAGLPIQQFDRNVVTVVEKWRNIEALHAHLAAPHMLGYKEKVKEMVEAISVKVLRET